jgi:hypothetical protein
MITCLLNLILLSALPCPEPNEACLNALVDNWLKVNPIVNRQVYVQGEPSDPNNREYCKYVIKQWQFHPLTIMDLDMDGVINLRDFAVLSACYVPTVVIPEPNMPEPNDNAFGLICYTVGGKSHLYSDCRYIKDKAWSPCLCNDPNNNNGICLTCLARKAREE